MMSRLKHILCFFDPCRHRNEGKQIDEETKTQKPATDNDISHCKHGEGEDNGRKT